MFCTTCGNELKLEERFCTRCGTEVLVESDPVSTSVPSSDPIPAQLSARQGYSYRRSSRKGFIFGVLGVLVALAAVVGATVMLAGAPDVLLAHIVSSEPGSVSAEYGSSVRLEVAASTRIIPLGMDDAPLSSYQMRVKQADDASGRFIEIDELPALSVTGDEGFSLSEFGVLDEGTYLLCLQNEAGAAYDLPPLTLGEWDEDEVANRIEVGLPLLPVDSSQLVKRGRYGCLLDALTDDVQTHGDVSLIIMQSSEGSYLAWVAGVSYAELVDFGDGVERLVIVSCVDGSLARAQVVEVDEDAAAEDFGPRANQYTAQVYEHDSMSDEPMLVAELSLPGGDSDRPRLRYVIGSTGQELLVVTDSSGGEACFGLSSTGMLSTLPSDEADPARLSTARAYRFVSEASTQEGALHVAETGECSCEQTAQTVKDLMARLSALSDDAF